MRQVRRAGSNRKGSKFPPPSVRILCGLGLLTLLLVAPPSFAAEDPIGQPDPLFDDIFDAEFYDGPVGYADPLESTNRGVFAFNRQVDKWLLDPITKGFQWVVPKPVRNALSRMFMNLSSTGTLVNDLLQLEWKDAGITGSRLVVNTTVGLVGLFDVAKSMGLERHQSDFGQTLALAGTPSGPYLIMPIFGPGNARDTTGAAVDFFFQPTFYFLGPAQILIYSGSSGISTRDQFYRELKALEDSSIDYYAALRSGFYQRRISQIWARREDHRTHGELIYGGETSGDLAGPPDDSGEERAE